jgi:hypothetical protein
MGEGVISQAKGVMDLLWLLAEVYNSELPCNGRYGADVIIGRGIGPPAAMIFHVPAVYPFRHFSPVLVREGVTHPFLRQPNSSGCKICQPYPEQREGRCTYWLYRVTNHPYRTMIFQARKG